MLKYLGTYDLLAGFDEVKLIPLEVHDRNLDIKAAIHDACVEFLQTPEGKAAIDEDGVICYEHFVLKIPNEICIRHGIKKCPCVKADLGVMLFDTIITGAEAQSLN